MSTAVIDVTLSLQESAGAPARVLATCCVELGSQAQRADGARAGVASGAELRVVDFARGTPLPTGTKLGRVVCVSPDGKQEFERFCRYLAAGVDGKSARKAAQLGALPTAGSGEAGGSAVQLFLLPPWTAGIAALELIAVGLAKPPPPSAAGAPPPPPPPPAVRASDFPPSADGHGREFYPRQAVKDALKSPAATAALAERVAGWITAGAISFPYKRHYTSGAQLERMFARVRAVPAPPTDGAIRFGPYALAGFQPLMLEPEARALGGGTPFTAAVDGGVCLALVAAPAAAHATAGGAAAATVGALLLPPVAARTSVAPADVTLLVATSSGYLPFDRELNEDGGHLVDYFAEPARMAARRRDQAVRSDELWRQPGVARKVVDKALRKLGELTDLSLRRGTYGHVSGCNLFHANLATRLYTLLGGTRVLDPCAGWGDRLMGALANERVVLYRGFDPNPLLVQPHGEMLATFGPRRATDGGAAAAAAPSAATAAAAASTTTQRSSFLVQHVPFEDADVLGSLVGTSFATAGGDGGAQSATPTPFDLVLTSPPYFDLELYNETPATTPGSGGGGGGGGSHAAGAAATSSPAGGLETQSVDRFGSSLRAWLETWYCPMLAKAWGLLAAGGHMAIYINDHIGGGGGGAAHEPLVICEPMLQFAASLPDSVWVGCLGIEGETGSIRPLWLWRKGAPTASTPLPPLYALVASSAASGAASARLQPPPPPGSLMPPPPPGSLASGGAVAAASQKRPRQQQDVDDDDDEAGGEEGDGGEDEAAGGGVQAYAPLYEDDDALSSSSSPSIQAWLRSAFAVVDAGDDAASLRAAIASRPAGSQLRDVINAQDAEGKDHLTLLMRACKAGRVACVRALLDEHGADVNAVAERSQYTALSLAAYAHGGNRALVDCLLGARADPMRMNRYGESAIRVAETRGHAALADRLRLHVQAAGGSPGGDLLVAAPSPPLLRALGAGGVLPVTFRPACSTDQAALVALYSDGQLLYKAGPLAPAHEAWLATVLATDFKDAAGHYRSIPRAQLWVATVPLASAAAAFGLDAPAAAAAAAAAPAGPPSAGAAAAAGGIPRKAAAGTAAGGVPRKGGSGTDSASASIAPELAAYVDATGGCLLVGCVAVIPALLPAASSSGSGSGSGSGGNASPEWSSEAAALQTRDARTSRACELQRMCVHSRLRRCGLATALLRHAEAWAAASGYARVVLSTLASMAPAVALYPARGYAPTGPPGGTPTDYHGCAIRVVTFERSLAATEAR